MADGRKRRDSKKEAFWRRTLDQHRDSGLSVRAWCRKQGLKEAAFYWWRRQLARRKAGNGESVFVPVQVSEDGPRDADPQIEIVLTDGRCVRVTGSVNRQMLTDVLEVLASAGSVEPERRAC